MKNAAATTGYPSQIKYIVGNEAAERFSFYGMRSILVVFMTTQLLMAAPNAKGTYHFFVSASYLLPLLGAFLSDRYLGKYKTIMSLSIVYCLGHLTLALWDGPTGMVVGLALIALGAGGIKPCVSAHVGDQFNASNKDLIKGVFDIFYWSINFGSFFSTLLIPVLYVKYGAGVAFGTPGILMAVATFVFWLGRNQYVHVPPSRGTGDAGFLAIVAEAFRNRSRRKPGESLLDGARQRFGAEAVEGAKAAWDLMKVYLTVSIFWALYDQNGSSWVLQAQQMDLNVLGIHLEASQIQSLNPILVMVLIPICAYGLYPAIEKLGFKMTPLRKMSAGMLMAAFSFVVVAVIQNLLDAGVKLNVAWQGVAFLILTLSEVMISIPGLEFSYTQAPRAMKSTLMSFWFLTIFAGNFLTGFISEANFLQGASFFWFFAALMGAISVIFVISASRYKMREYIEGQDTPERAGAHSSTRVPATAEA